METSSSMQELLVKQQQIYKDFTELATFLKANPNDERAEEIKVKLEELKLSYIQVQQQLKLFESSQQQMISQLQPKEGILGLLKHLFDILLLKTGSRITRGEYFLTTLMLTILPILGGVIWSTLGGILGALAGIWNIILLVKRLQDLGRGWRNLLGFIIPIYNIYLYCICLFSKGTTGENKYGEDPLIGQEKFTGGSYWGLGSIFLGFLGVIYIIGLVILGIGIKTMAPVMQEAFEDMSSNTGIWSNMPEMNVSITMNGSETFDQEWETLKVKIKNKKISYEDFFLQTDVLLSSESANSIDENEINGIKRLAGSYFHNYLVGAGCMTPDLNGNYSCWEKDFKAKYIDGKSDKVLMSFSKYNGYREDYLNNLNNKDFGNFDVFKEKAFIYLQNDNYLSEEAKQSIEQDIKDIETWRMISNRWSGKSDKEIEKLEKERNEKLDSMQEQVRIGEINKQSELLQLADAMIAYRQDKGKFPEGCRSDGSSTSVIEENLKKEGYLPSAYGKNVSNNESIHGLGIYAGVPGRFMCMSGKDDFILMMETTIPELANWTVDHNGVGHNGEGAILQGTDISLLKPCDKVEGVSFNASFGSGCQYELDYEYALRYIYVYTGLSDSSISAIENIQQISIKPDLNQSSSSHFSGCDKDDIVIGDYTISACEVGSSSIQGNGKNYTWDQAQTLCTGEYYLPSVRVWDTLLIPYGDSTKFSSLKDDLLFSENGRRSGYRTSTLENVYPFKMNFRWGYLRGETTDRNGAYPVRCFKY